MKCPKCGYISFDYNYTCPNCNNDLSEEKKKFGLFAFKPSPVDWLLEEEEEQERIQDVLTQTVIGVEEGVKREEEIELEAVSLESLVTEDKEDKEDMKRHMEKGVKEDKGEALEIEIEPEGLKELELEIQKMQQGKEQISKKRKSDLQGTVLSVEEGIEIEPIDLESLEIEVEEEEESEKKR